MIEKLRQAAQGWGWLLAIAVAVVALSLSAASDVQPVEEAYDAAEALVTSGPCPEGWENHTDDGDHTIVRRCEQGDWIVFLDDAGKFSHAGQRNAEGYIVRFTEASAEVPGWPAGR